MENLPVELISRIIDYLAPQELATLQLVSKQLLVVTRDNTLWRSRCYGESFTCKHGCFPDVITPKSTTVKDANEDSEDHNHEQIVPTAAEWDPSEVGEDVNWYAEYVCRYAPISFQWLKEEQCTADDADEDNDARRWPARSATQEVKGMGLFKDRSYGSSDRVVGPLNDGSVCVWDLNRSTHRSERTLRGRVAGLSEPSVLTLNRSQTTNSTTSDANVDFIGVGDCVSVDSARQRAYIAVGTNLNEVDINTLQIISSQKYAWSIFALSQEIEDYAAPLTVATTLSLNIYDSRCSGPGSSGNHMLPADPRSATPQSRLCTPLPRDDNDFASLFQPGPLSVTHTPLPNINSIFLAGRFPSVLLYDRRFFPRLQGAAHSGGRLCSSVAIPAAPHRNLPGGRDWTGFHTAVACGEYNGRGSLELYALSAMTQSDDYMNAASPSLEKDSVFQNRQSASSSKLLSVASHGTRLVYSDAGGNITWVERDARTPVRSWNINKEPHRLRGPRNLGDNETSAPSNREDSAVIRKILPTGEELENDEILVWTGDRIGRLRFSPRSDEDLDEDEGEDGLLNGEGDANEMTHGVSRRRQRRENADNSRLERDYLAAMERSLRVHTDQLSWMPNLGSGD